MTQVKPPSKFNLARQDTYSGIRFPSSSFDPSDVLSVQKKVAVSMLPSYIHCEVADGGVGFTTKYGSPRPVHGLW